MIVAQIHIGIYAWHHTALRKLPYSVFSVPHDFGLVVGVTAYVKRIFIEIRGKVVVIKRHGGKIEAFSEVNHGAEFILYFLKNP